MDSRGTSQVTLFHEDNSFDPSVTAIKEGGEGRLILCFWSLILRISMEDIVKITLFI